MIYLFPPRQTMNNTVAREHINAMIKELCSKPGMYGITTAKELQVSTYPLFVLSYVESSNMKYEDFISIPEINALFFSSRKWNALYGNLPQEDLIELGKQYISACNAAEEKAKKNE